MNPFYEFLDTHEIQYERHDHPAVFTVEDVKRLAPRLPAAETKNLFLRESKKNNHFLVVVGADKRVNLKALGLAIGIKRLTFGSPERLNTYLGVEPGSVSLFAVFNDREKAVHLIVDQDLWASDAFQFHPLINTSTLVITKPNLIRFLDATGHEPRIIEVPDMGCGRNLPIGS